MHVARVSVLTASPACGPSWDHLGARLPRRCPALRPATTQLRLTQLLPGYRHRHLVNPPHMLRLIRLIVAIAALPLLVLVPVFPVPHTLRHHLSGELSQISIHYMSECLCISVPFVAPATCWDASGLGAWDWGPIMNLRVGRRSE